jgi:hypothetical protein
VTSMAGRQVYTNNRQRDGGIMAGEMDEEACLADDTRITLSIDSPQPRAYTPKVQMNSNRKLSK